MFRRILIAAALTAACASTQATMPDPSSPQRLPVCPAGVQLFTDQSKVGSPYTEVAILTWHDDDPTSGIEKMIKSQRKKAGELGANALILGQSAQMQGRQRCVCQQTRHGDLHSGGYSSEPSGVSSVLELATSRTAP